MRKGRRGCWDARRFKAHPVQKIYRTSIRQPYDVRNNHLGVWHMREPTTDESEGHTQRQGTDK